MFSVAVLSLHYLLIAVVIHQASAVKTEKEYLAEFLLRENEYDASVSPSSCSSSKAAVIIKFGLSYHCARICERSRVLTSRVTERYQWTDKRLSWNPRNTSSEQQQQQLYEGIYTISLPDHLIWTPDVRLLNGISKIERDPVDALILYNGTVLWIVQTTYKSLCIPNKDSAFGCTFKFGSWTHDLNVTLEMFHGGMDTDSYYEECRPYVMDKYRTRMKDNTFPDGSNYFTFEVEYSIKKTCSGSVAENEYYNGCECG